jgi:hypothetical protein
LAPFAQAFIMSVQNGLFDNVMTDVSGKVRLESEDPRWIQLFSTKTISQLSAEEVGWYAVRLIEHNPATGNLIQMLDQTSSKLQQVTSRRTSPPSQLTEQCCSALFLTTLLLHHIIAHSSLSEVSTRRLVSLMVFNVERSCHNSVQLLRQLQITEGWADQDLHKSGYNQSQTTTSRSGDVVGKLIHELVTALDAPTAK